MSESGAPPAKKAPQVKARTRRPFWKGLQAKAILLFIAIAVIPAALVAALLFAVNREAVTIAERQRQAAALSMARADSLRIVAQARQDALAVAHALARASDDPKSGMNAAKSVLATRETFRAMRFEVPSAGTDSVISLPGADLADVPHSTPELRKAADEKGLTIQVR